MSTNKFITILDGVKKLVTAIAASTGSGDASKIIATNADGKLDPTFLPTGAGVETLSIMAAENLAAGDLVNVFNDAGTRRVRKADASNNRPAHGFVEEALASPAAATVYFSGQINNQLTGLITGTRMYLATTAGQVTATPPSSSGEILQFVGAAVGADSLLFVASESVEIE